jgi:Holliday junction resolvase RusA-like endonuclease
MITFRVDGPPRGKGRPRASSRGGHVRLYTDEKTITYERQLAEACKADMVLWDIQPLTGPLKVTVAAFFTPPKSATKKAKADMLAGVTMHTVKPDLDNIVKCLDGINGIAYVDDAQIVQIEAAKAYAEAAYVEVTIQEVK